MRRLLLERERLCEEAVSVRGAKMGVLVLRRSASVAESDQCGRGYGAGIELLGWTFCSDGAVL